MKWAALAIALVAILPLAGWLRANPREAHKVWIVLGLMPFLAGALKLDVSVIDWAGWPGYVKGLQITGVDCLALAIYIALPRRRRPLPFKIVMALYFIAVVVSIFHAQVPMASVFYAWQLARVFLVYAIVAQACEDLEALRSLLTGLAIGLCYQAMTAVWQRYGLGKLQVSGSLGHQNTLGLISHFIVYPAFALLLAGERGWQLIVVPIAGVAIAVLTTSRATIGLAAIGLTLVFALSILRGWTPRKSKVLVAGILGMALAAPIAYSSFQQRFSKAAPEGVYDERAAFEKAASMILADHPMGAGANNYIVVANGGGYLDQAGVGFARGSRGTFVHNLYWLTAAEIGYFGVLALILMIFRVATTALRCGLRTRGDPRGDLMLGLGVALLMVAIHSLYEWVFVFSFVQYLFAISAGMIAGLAAQVTQPRSRAAESDPVAGAMRRSTSRANASARLISFRD